jgi:hypothetical protein
MGRPRLTSRVLVAGGLCLVTIAGHADAQPRAEKPRVSIAVVGCEDTLAREAQRIAAIELRAALVEETPDAATTQVEATCTAETVAIRVVDPTTGKSLERSVALWITPRRARARLVALAIAELVTASWYELERNPEPKAPPVVPLAPERAREAARAVIARLPVEFAAVADANLLASGDWVVGGGARGEVWIAPGIFLRFDGLAHYADLARPSGTVALTMASASAALGASFDAAWLQPRASVGVRGGYAWMSGVAGGSATTGYHEEGPWGGPELAVEAAAWPRAHVHPVLSLSAGVHVLGVRGTVNEGRDIMVTGLWGGLSLAIAVQ